MEELAGHERRVLPVEQLPADLVRVADLAHAVLLLELDEVEGKRFHLDLADNGAVADGEVRVAGVRLVHHDAVADREAAVRLHDAAGEKVAVDAEVEAQARRRSRARRLEANLLAEVTDARGGLEREEGLDLRGSELQVACVLGNVRLDGDGGSWNEQFLCVFRQADLHNVVLV